MICSVEYFFFGINAPFPDPDSTTQNPDQLWGARSGVWSATCDTVAQIIEPGAGKAIDRIEAARKCREMGVPVRIKFKPMIPVRDWRREYAEVIEQTVKRAKHESIGFCVIMWMDIDGLAACFDLDVLDPDFDAAARAASDRMKGVRVGPFPLEVRREVYQNPGLRGP